MSEAYHVIQPTRALRAWPVAPFLLNGVGLAGTAWMRVPTSYDVEGKGAQRGSFAFFAVGRINGKGGDGVKVQGTGQTSRGKVVAVGLLFVTSAAITLLGLAFCAMSAWYHWEYLVFQTKVPGVAFGVVIAFLGMRYTLAVYKLKREVYKSDVRFSWSNFRKKQAKPAK